MAQEEEGMLSLVVQDRIDEVARRRELRGGVALSLAAAAVALGLVNFTGSWLGLLPILAVPFFLRRMALR